MTNSPHDLARHIRTTNTATCSRCGKEVSVDGERTRFSVAEYLIRKGWSATDDEIVCGKCEADVSAVGASAGD